MFKNFTFKLLLALIVCSLSSSLYAQGLKERSANKKYEVLSFFEAAEMYSELAKKKDASAHQIRRAAESYRYTGNSVQSEKWYSKLYKHNGRVAEDLYHYAQMLKMNEKYTEAGKVMAEYSAKRPSHKGAKAHVDNPSYFEELKSTPSKYAIAAFNVNSISSDFAPTYYTVNGESSLVFASARTTNSSLLNNKSQWDGSNFLDTYIAQLGGDGENVEVERFNHGTRSKYHEGPISFSNNGSVMYVTRSNYLNKKKGRDSVRINNLKIYISTKDENGAWGKLTDFEYNSDSYSVGHASVTEDGKTMYFVSDMPGSKGETDIWVSTMNDSVWSKPKNLKSLNTEGKEMFPFISSNGSLYFSTDGLLGLGGQDIFKAESNGNGDFMEPENMKFPLNTNHDDFGFITNYDETEGYFSSDRNGMTSKGSDDIYRFKLNKPSGDKKKKVMLGECSLVGTITDSKTNEPIEGVSVKLRDRITGEVNEFITDNNGRFVNLLTGKQCPGYKMDCDVIIQKKDYMSKTVQFTKEFTEVGEVNLNEYIDTKLQSVKVGTEIAELCSIEDVLYDLNKSNIRPDAALELDKLVACMKANPFMRVEIGSHTDCRASEAYNMKLSNDRAKSARDYVVSKGISSDRIFGKGYGESKLLNDCGCEINAGSDCSEKQHQMNRRTEFRIVSGS